MKSSMKSDTTEELFTYDIEACDATTSARAGSFVTAHGIIPTPIFMPVGTKATVKGVWPQQLKGMGAKIILANTYHLSQRPGANLIHEMGGLHAFEKWDGPILTDSGGFQVFSLSEHMKLSDDGISFRAVDYDGAHVTWTPEKNMAIQEALGSDICMQLDVCPPYPATREIVARAVELSSAWAKRCNAAHTKQDQALFGIVQGGMYLDLRKQSIEALEEIGGFPGYGIGGFSVGEDHETMFETLEPLCKEYMPQEKPRYLMGVGNPTTLLKAIAMGVDMFDCVLPTRTARMGTAFSSQGRLNLKNAQFERNDAPLDKQCTCPVCTQAFSKAYLHHLVKQKEILAAEMLSVHNLHYLIHLMADARNAILAHSYEAFLNAFLASPAAHDF